MTKTGSSLRLRLSIAGLALLFIACVLSFQGLSLLFERHVERRIASELESDLSQLVANLERNETGELLLARDPLDARFARPLSGHYWKIVSDDQVLRSRSLWDADLAIPPVGPGLAVLRLAAGPADGDVFMVAREITGGHRLGNQPILFAVAVDRAEIERARTEFRKDMAPYLAVLGIVLLIANLAQIHLGLLPLATVRRRISEIRSGAAQRMDGVYPSEIRPLTEEVDALLISREEQLLKARQQAADLAHGLKTPLQALAGDVERLKAAGQVDLAGEIGLSIAAMRRHVDHQLARARLSGPRKDKRSSLAHTAGRVIGVLERTPRGQMMDWTVDIPDQLTARIDSEDLAELLGNLLENAVRYAESAVSLEAGSDGRTTWLTVADDGPGIPQDKLALVTARGTRLDTSSDGAGLGLAIVEEIIAANDGSIAFDAGSPGLRVTVRLPSG